MGLLNTGSATSLYAKGDLRVIGDEYGQFPTQYTQIFSEQQATQKVESVPHLGALSRWNTTANTEGASFNQDGFTEADTATFTMAIYTNSYDITYEAVKWDQYDKMNRNPKQLVRGLYDLLEYKAASVINDGFATTTGYDGAYLFSHSHDLNESATKGDNLFTGAISYANVKAGKLLLEETVQESNILILAKADTLWCSSNIESDAFEILGSSNIAGELSNTANVLPKMGPLKVASLSYVTDGYYGLKDSRFASNNLIMMWFTKPEFGMQDVPGTRNTKVWGYAAFAAGYADWRGIVGSTG
jgi:hypothetical protein